MSDHSVLGNRASNLAQPHGYGCGKIKDVTVKAGSLFSIAILTIINLARRSS